MGDEKWCKLHRDLFELILKKVASSIGDMARFQAVCWSWNFAAKSFVEAPYDQPPLLMHLNDNVHDGSVVSSNPNEKDSVYFFSMTEKTVYKLDHVFEDEGYNFASYKWNVVGGSHGWLVVYRRSWRFDHPDDSTIWLFNPITGDRIDLPMIFLLADCFLEFYMKIMVGEDLNRSQIESIAQKITLLAAKVIFDNSSFAVVVIYQGPFINYQTLAFWKLGNNAWTSLGRHYDHDRADLCFCDCIEFVNGQLFASFMRTICIWDLRSDSGESYNFDNLAKPPIADFQPFMDAVYCNHVKRKNSDARTTRYLVESAGELLVVERYSTRHCIYDESTGNPLLVARNYPFPHMYKQALMEKYTYSHYFFVFKLNLSDKKWERVEHLHGRALCLDYRRSGISILTENFQEFEENTIYFMCDDLDMQPLFQDYTLGLAFNMKSTIVHTFYKFKNFGTWIVPDPW